MVLLKLVYFEKPCRKICKIHKLDSIDVDDLVAFNNPNFENTLKKALNILIDTMFRSENDDKYRQILSDRFSDMINQANAPMITAICDKDVEDAEFPYYFAVVDAKSFGKYLIPTHK